MCKLLLIHPDKCQGCMTCEMVCSAKHENAINPFQSRIKIIKWGLEGEGFPTVCAQCEDAPCIKACKDDAIARAADNTIAIDPERCTNCGLCVRACPFDAIFLHPDTECAVTCDLCSGTPVCVKYCPTKCITYSSWEESLEAERGSETTLYKSLI